MLICTPISDLDRMAIEAHIKEFQDDGGQIYINNKITSGFTHEFEETILIPWLALNPTWAPYEFEKIIDLFLTELSTLSSESVVHLATHKLLPVKASYYSIPFLSPIGNPNGLHDYRRL